VMCVKLITVVPAIEWLTGWGLKTLFELGQRREDQLRPLRSGTACRGVKIT